VKAQHRPLRVENRAENTETRHDIKVIDSMKIRSCGGCVRQFKGERKNRRTLAAETVHTVSAEASSRVWLCSGTSLLFHMYT